MKTKKVLKLGFFIVKGRESEKICSITIINLFIMKLLVECFRQSDGTGDLPGK